MKCTNKQQETAECEKRGCEGCYYNKEAQVEVLKQINTTFKFSEKGYWEDKIEKMNNDINKAKCEMMFLIPVKIKMKEQFYNKLAIECQKIVSGFSEVLDKNKQPLNTFYGLQIEIDNKITSDYKIVIDNLEENNGN